MRITEDAVIKAAVQWAERRGTNATKASADALQQIGVLRTSFTGEQYMDQLEQLYRQYTAS